MIEGQDTRTSARVRRDRGQGPSGSRRGSGRAARLTSRQVGPIQMGVGERERGPRTEEGGY